ncbi:MAG: DUF1611 domain-containing protein [FCB group bacterium]|nr:DUF1611 domain-containing protein [FCB group bacterium]
MLIRYFPDRVLAVIDPQKAGKTAQDVIGYGGDIPVVNTFSETVSLRPDTILIGNAPQGGRITPEYRAEILAAIAAHCNVISGMHVFLGEDPEIRSAADRAGVELTDLRRPPKPPHFPRGSWKDRKTPVMLVVGTDCDTGKMTTAWELTLRLRQKGWKVEFVGTGQTGILLGGQGVPVDAVVADFMAGEIEYVIDHVSENTDLIVVEGQGSITNMYYSGVTLGLLHGAMPDWMIMTHEPNRTLDVTDYPMADLESVMRLHVDLMKPFKSSKILGFNLLTHALNEEEAIHAMDDLESKFNIPATDLIRFGNRELVTTIDQELKSWT